MNLKDNLNQNHLISSNDSNHDSDIESRLYAEIYFSNTIEGDDNLVNSETNNEIPNSIKIDANSSKDINNFIFFEKNTNQFAQINSDHVNNECNNDTEILLKDLETNLEYNNTFDESEILNVQTEINIDNSLHTNQNMNIPKISNRIQKSNKRSANDNYSNKSIQSVKKKSKYGDKVDNISTQTEENRSNSLVNNSNNKTVSCLRNEIHNLQKDNSVINPCTSNTQFIQLLSPEFYNLFFGKKVKKKKVENLPKKVKNKKSKKKSLEVSKCNVVVEDNTSTTKNENNIQQNGIIDKISGIRVQKDNTKIIENNVSSKNNIEQNILTESNDERDISSGNNIEQNILTESNVEQDISSQNNNEQNISSDVSEIIDISSESSKDSIENNSKYNTIIATDKKLKQRESGFIDKNSEDSVSDSEESIFEVPVPRKPTPPLIELKDSDNGSDSDSFLSNSLMAEENETQNIETSFHRLVNPANEVCSINSESNDANDLVLNCTQIQNHVSSLDEIKRLNQLSNIRETLKESNTIGQTVTLEEDSLNILDINSCAVPNSVCEQDNLNNFTINPKITSTKKVMNTLNDKEQNKSYHSKQNVPIEEYFFQPMSNEMKSFYNKSWGGEHFDMDKLKSKMSTDPNKWAVLDNDVLFSFSQSKRYFGIVCNRCEKVGHKQNQCPQPYKFPICHMCGSAGHFETSCNHKKCLTCGTKQSMYRKTCENCKQMYCSRCSSQGHLSNSCPDLWRRYHQTINNNNAEAPTNVSNVMKPQNELYCCNCAKKGHDSVNCKKFRWSQHFPNPPYVSSYSGPDYCSEQFYPSMSPDNTHSDSVNPNTMYDNSDNIDFTSDDLEINNLYNLDETFYNESCDFDINKESNNLEVRQNLSQNDTMNLNKTIIFKIASKVFSPNNSYGTFRLKINISNRKVSKNLDDWKILFKFLELLKYETTIDFLLKQDNKKAEINMICLRKYHKALSNLIHQFMQRSNYERCYMFYTHWHRNPQKISKYLSTKINEMRNITECPLQLYEQVKELTTEMMYNENKFENDCRNSILMHKLSLCQRKLLMVLYREGYGDDSLKELTKIYNGITNKKYCLAFQNKKLTKAKVPQHISIKCLFEYLYYYNNVFVPHEPKNLPNLINLYKEHIEMRYRIENNPLLFPPEQNIPITYNQPNEIVISENDNIVGSCSNYLMPLSSPPISSFLPTNTLMIPQEPQLLPAIITAPQIQSTEFVNTSINSIPINDKRFPTTNLKSAQTQATKPSSSKIKNKLKKIPNSLYTKSLECKNEKKRKKFKTRFKKFIKDAKSLITEACNLNAPHLQNDIINLQRKLENEIYLCKKDVKPLKKSVQLEVNRRAEDCKELTSSKKFANKCKKM